MRRVTTKRMAILGGVAALALTAAACGSSSNSGKSASTVGGAGAGVTTTSASGSGGYSYGGGRATTTTAGGASGAAQAALVSVASNKLGNILVDGNGKTLYVYDKDPLGKSACNGACAQAWPPLAPPASGTPAYGSGLSPSMFTIITRDDGSKQIAVNGHPLYGWVADKQAGQTTGQGVNGFYVTGANGEKIDKD